MLYITTIDLSTFVETGDDTTAILPKNVPIIVPKGSTFIWKITLTIPASGIGWTTGQTLTSVAMKMRKEAVSSVVAISLTSSPAAGIVLTGTASAPIITVTMTAAQTAALVFSTQVLGSSQGANTRGDVGVYDMEATLSDGRIFRILQGAAQLDAEVTYT
jgi:hypothetical protein